MTLGVSTECEAEKVCRSWQELLGLTMAGSLLDGIKELNCKFQSSCWCLAPQIRFLITLRCPGTLQVHEIKGYFMCLCLTCRAKKQD